jgi:DNA primase
LAFSPAFLDELRRRLSIFDLVGRKVRLNRRGKQATGLCPFHNEKSPSFHVYDDDEPHYHCFGCGAHGDAITFVMQTEGLEFRDAVERLASEAGLEVPKDTPQERERAERQASLGTVMEAACAFFEQQLAGSPGAGYFKSRGLTAETIRRFRLGFAPESRTALKSHLAKLNIPELLAIEAGMLVKPEDGGPSYDRFRNRVIFPIADTKGRIVAFGGRVLGDEKPKYLNSPETPLFSKGRQLYNMNHAQKAAREKSEVIVVEGYMDAIALAQAGFPQVVAPLGTALTEDQIEILWRMAPEPILCFDDDSAGEKAAGRAIQQALPILRPGLSLRFAWMQAGEDPDELVRSQGVSAMRTILDRSEPLCQIAWNQVEAGRPRDTPERRAGFRSDLLAMTDRIRDPSVRQAYRQEVEARLASRSRPPAITVNVKSERPRGFLSPVYASGGGQAAKRGFGGVRRHRFDVLMSIALHHVDILHRYVEMLSHFQFPTGTQEALKSAAIRIANQEPEADRVTVLEHLRAMGFGPEMDRMFASAAIDSLARPSTPSEYAELEFLHVAAVLREPDIAKDEKEAGQKLGTEMSEDALQGVQSLVQTKLEAESKRRDVDRVADLLPRPKRKDRA